MYIELRHHYPAPGKGPELRANLEEWAKTAPSRGFRHSLTTQLLSQDGPVYVNGILHDTLADWGAYPQRSAAHPAQRTFIEKNQGLNSRPNLFTLYEVLVPMGTGDPFRYIRRITRYPAPGKGPSLRALMEERVKTAQARGRRHSLHAQMFSPEGQVFVHNIGDSDLVTMESQVRAFSQDPEAQELAEKVGALEGRPAKVELFEVLVPFGAR